MFGAGASRWKVEAHDLIWSWRGLFWASLSKQLENDCTVVSLCFWQELCLPLLNNLTTQPYAACEVCFGIGVAAACYCQNHQNIQYQLVQCEQCRFMWTPRDWIDHSYFVAVRVSHYWAHGVGLWLIEHLLPLACRCGTSQQWRIRPWLNDLNEWKAIRFIPLLR